MSIKMKLSFSIFLMLMLTQAALSVPVEKNSEVKDGKAKGGEVEVQNIPAEILNKLKGLIDELSHLKVVEDSKKVAEKVTNLVKDDLADLKAKLEDILKHITSAETKKKVQDVLTELSNKKLFKDTKTVIEGLITTIEKELSAAVTKAEDVLKRIDTPEKLKNVDLKRELAKLKLKETIKNITQQVENVLKNEYSGAKAKIEDLINHVYSAETMQKLEEILEKLNTLKVVEATRNMAEKVENVVRHELPGVTAKVDNVVNHINSAGIQAKVDDLIDEVASLNIPELVKKLNEGAKNAVEQQLHNIKVKADEIAKIATSPETKKKLQDLSNDVANIKIVKTLINIAEGLKNLVEQELKPEKKNKN